MNYDSFHALFSRPYGLYNLSFFKSLQNLTDSTRYVGSKTKTSSICSWHFCLKKIEADYSNDYI